ncbi:MAG: hypothetical protein LBJ76_04690 [Candidatus Accumulibacter sp.]|jgi:hypothetical protein|nr:hypothetical protein [Accumulibacter sp.]
MADHHARHNPLGQDALFITPASLMLDARLTPLERNGWQVLRMLCSAEGISPLASLGRLRRYLTSTPLGKRAGYEMAWRVLVVLCLSELYQVHKSALDSQQACALMPCPR